MKRKLPDDAFSHFVGLGIRRNFQAVAERYGVTRQAVAKRAHREFWVARATEIDAAAQLITKEQLLRARMALFERLATLWAVAQTKAIEALRDKSFRHGLDAVRALDLANSGLSRMLYMQETARLDLAAVNAENTERARVGVDALTDNQLARRMIDFEERKRRAREAKATPTEGGATA